MSDPEEFEIVVFLKSLYKDASQIVQLQKDSRATDGDIKIAYKAVVKAKAWGMMRSVDKFKKWVLEHGEDAEENLFRMSQFPVMLDG